MFIFDHQDGYESEEESHNFYEFVFCKKGQFIQKIENDFITVNEDEIIFIPPNVSHKVIVKNSDANIFIASFDSTSQTINFFERYHAKLDKNSTSILNLLFLKADDVFLLSKAIKNEYKTFIKNDVPVGSLQVLKNILEVFLINIINSDKDISFYLDLDSNSLSNLIDKYLRDNLTKKITIGDLINKFGYTKSYLSRVFKKNKGQTIMSYFNILKIEKAQKLILSGEMNITEISNYLDFDTPNYFTKSFKKITGKTPSQYKNLHTLKN